MFWKNNDREFEAIFKSHVSLSVKAVEELLQLLQTSEGMEQRHQAIIQLEHQADQLVARAHELLDNTFITRLDKPDIVQLTDELDNVIDGIKVVADRVKVYNPNDIRPGALAITEIIRQMIVELEQIFGNVSKLKQDKVKKHLAAIKDLEEQADAEFLKDLHQLFTNGSDWKTVIIWKDIFQILERITDRCENVVNIVNSIVRKEAR